MLRQYSKGLLTIYNLSDARDTRILESLLASESTVLNAKDAGTTFRFLTSYLAISGRKCTLTGSDRMKHRPIGDLVYSLQLLGAHIEYLEKEGFPPLKFNGFKWTGISSIDIDASVSSQFTSALMMAGPTLENGLIINFKGEGISSLPYIRMTHQLMAKMGIAIRFEENQITIPAQAFQPSSYTIESDWSAASYWYGIVAMANQSDIFLVNLRQDSLQGDSVIQTITENWGVRSTFEKDGVRIEKTERKSPPQKLELNFMDCPDLGQTVIALCAASGTGAFFTGLKSLAIKETNRLRAMKSELQKAGIAIEIDEKKGTCFIASGQTLREPTESFETYDDHRMAMALSLFALKFPIRIKHPEVVDKSYPQFWKALQSAGFQIHSDPA